MKAFILVAMICAPLAASADNSAKTKLTSTELQILAHYHKVNQLEIDLGKQAQKHGTPAIQTYGAMLVTEHSDNDVKLKDFAKRFKQSIPNEKLMTDADKQADRDTKKQVTALTKLKGVDFDREYLRMMVDGHDKELGMIDNKIEEATAAKDDTLVDMLRTMKPTLQKHADNARELQKSANTPSAMR